MANIEKKKEKLRKRIELAEAQMRTVLNQKSSGKTEINISRELDDINHMREQLRKLG